MQNCSESSKQHGGLQLILSILVNIWKNILFPVAHKNRIVNLLGVCLILHLIAACPLKKHKMALALCCSAIQTCCHTLVLCTTWGRSRKWLDGNLGMLWMEIGQLPLHSNLSANRNVEELDIPPACHGSIWRSSLTAVCGRGESFIQAQPGFVARLFETGEFFIIKIIKNGLFWMLINEVIQTFCLSAVSC